MDITAEDLFSVGCVASVIRIIKLQNGNAKILIQGVMRAKIVEIKVEESLLVKGS